MGIKGLRALLKTHGVREESVDLVQFSNLRVAVDVPFLAYKFKGSNAEKWLSSFKAALMRFATYHVYPVFVFDGTAPPEKTLEKLERRRKRQEARERADRLRVELATYEKEGGEPGPALEKLIRSVKKKNDVRSVLPQELRRIVAKRQAQPEMTSADYDVLRDVVRSFGFSVVEAPGEAELFCVLLVKGRFADAVLTIDSDAIAAAVYYELPYVLTDIHGDRLTRLSTHDVTTKLAVTPSQFLDLCVVCGTDFNRRIERLGPVKALKALKLYGSIEGMSVAYPVDELNYRRVRAILTDGR